VYGTIYGYKQKLIGFANIDKSKGDTNFWDDFFVIPILPLKKLPKKQTKHNFHIKVGFQFFYSTKKNIFFFLITNHNKKRRSSSYQITKSNKKEIK
jgi:hypothetical protein